MKVKAVIFDLDGTLLNTLEDLADSCNAALKETGYPERSIEEIKNFVGNGLVLLMERALPAGRQNPDFNRAMESLRRHYANNWKNKTRAYPGIESLISKLNEQGIKTGIVSNKPDERVKDLAKLYFAPYISAECAVGEKEKEGIRKKPAPDSVFTVMKILGSSKENTVYVGDSDVDIETAANAGLPCISVTWGFRSRAFLLEHGAKYLADSCQDLIQVVENIF